MIASAIVFGAIIIGLYIESGLKKIALAIRATQR